MNTNNLLYLLIGGILVFIVLAWYGSATYEETPPTPVSTNTTEKPSLFRDSFIDACNETGEIESYCTCAWDYLSTNYSIDDLVWMNDNLTSQQTDQALGEAYNVCKTEAL